MSAGVGPEPATAAAHGALAELLPPGRRLRAVEPGILSALPPDAVGQPYDRKAAGYDALVGTRWYNRLLWGADRDDYAACARAALASATEGWHLDAGCGSLVATARAYADAPRSALLVDASLGMLRRAARRLREAGADAGRGAVLLQADLLALPLETASVASALCMGMLHLFDDAGARAVLGELRRVLRPGAPLHATSLVLGRGIGDRYLGVLERAGEVARPRTPDAVAALLGDAGFEVRERRTTGNMTYLVAAKGVPLRGT